MEKPEEKIETLQKELDQTKGYYLNMLKNNMLVPTNNTHPRNIENVRRSLNFNFDYELKEPVPKDRNDPFGKIEVQKADDSIKLFASANRNPEIIKPMLPVPMQPMENPAPILGKQAQATMGTSMDDTNRVVEPDVRTGPIRRPTNLQPQGQIFHSHSQVQQTHRM